MQSRLGLRVQRIVAAVILAGLALALTARCSGPGAVSPATYNQASMKTLEALWEQAGGSDATAVNAACHAMQESSGEPDVTSPNPDGGTNVGLWQLDTRGVGSGYTVAQLDNPLTNARVAVAGTDDGTDWSDWATPGC
jgi:Lysozyme like domain